MVMYEQMVMLKYMLESLLIVKLIQSDQKDYHEDLCSSNNDQDSELLFYEGCNNAEFNLVPYPIFCTMFYECIHDTIHDHRSSDG